MTIFKNNQQGLESENVGYIDSDGVFQVQTDLQTLINNMVAITNSGTLEAYRRDAMTKMMYVPLTAFKFLQESGYTETHKTAVAYKKGAVVFDNDTNLNIYYATQDVPVDTLLTNSTYWIFAFNLKTITNQLSAGQVVKQSTLTYKIKDGMVFENPAMTSNTLPTGWIASSSDSHVNAYMAFDKITTNYFAVNATIGWVMLQMPVARKIRGVRITNANSTTAANMKNVEYQGSNDGTTWDTLATETNRASTLGFSNVITINSVNAYSYFRVNILANWGSSVCDVPEVKIFFAEQNKLTQSVGFVNAKDYSKYINFTNEIDIDFDTNGLNALSTNTTLSANTWYYIFTCIKADGTSACIIDSNENGNDALIDFTNAGFNTNTMILSGVWKTNLNINLIQLYNDKPYSYSFIEANEGTYNLTGVAIEQILQNGSLNYLYPVGYKTDVNIFINHTATGSNAIYSIAPSYFIQNIKNIILDNSTASTGNYYEYNFNIKEDGLFKLSRVSGVDKTITIGCLNFKINI